MNTRPVHIGIGVDQIAQLVPARLLRQRLPVLCWHRADLKSIGFERKVKVWQYPYEHYGVQKEKGFWKTLRPYYKRAGDIHHYSTKNPLSERKALLLTNSFGAFVAPHLAVGFKDLYHVNVNHLHATEKEAFKGEFIDNLGVTDVILLVHDSAFVSKHVLSLIL